MGNQKQKWSPEEEEALLAGIAKHGRGKWKNILRDPEFAPFLFDRSNIDLKLSLITSVPFHFHSRIFPSNSVLYSQDKWRNLSVSVPKDKLQLPKKKKLYQLCKVLLHWLLLLLQFLLIMQLLMLSRVIIQIACRIARMAQVYVRYNELILEALSTIADSNGADIGTIFRYIEVQDNYRINRGTPLGARPTTPKQKNIPLRPIQAQSVLSPHENIQEAAMAEVYKVAEAENKSFLASEALREAERVSKMADDTDAMLQLMKEIYEHCSLGEIIVLA